MTPSKEQPATIDDLTLEQLTDLVNEASGWNDRANVTFRRETALHEFALPHSGLHENSRSLHDY